MSSHHDAELHLGGQACLALQRAIELVQQGSRLSADFDRVINKAVRADGRHLRASTDDILLPEKIIYDDIVLDLRVVCHRSALLRAAFDGRFAEVEEG